jgi:lysophospholipase L1-like esterase
VKTIVCFGDSNTWGFDPLQGSRFDIHQRWPGVLRNALSTEYWVVEEGMGGRTVVYDDLVEGFQCGRDYLIPCLKSHTPVDLVIIMLGTNDLKKRFSLPACDIAKGVNVLVDLVHKANFPPGYQAPQVLLIAPPPILEVGRFKEIFAGGAEKSLELGQYYADIAGMSGCYFIDAGKIICSSPVDGIHLDPGEHFKLGQAVAEKVKEILEYVKAPEFFLRY